MGDPKDAGQVDCPIKKDETGDGVEAVYIETEQNNANEESFDEKLALNLKMAAMLMPGVYNLPKSVRRTVRALKNLQLQHVNQEVEFFKELHELEMKYEKKFEPLYEKRSAIVGAAYLPTDDECEFLSDSERELELSHEVQKVKVEDDTGKEPEADVKGVPQFWLTAFKNAPSLADMIEEYDEPILKHLVDIKAVTYNDPMSFNLAFHFEPNDYFTNSTLTKHYELRCAPEEGDVFSFEGPEIVKCTGCTIDWKKGKNVTVKTVKKKQKHKARGAVRTVTKTIQTDSFFNFFSPPKVTDNEDEMDEETQGVLNNDFEVGNLLKDRIIPHAVLFFTGENLIDDDFDEEDDEEDEDEDYDENEDEEDEDEEETDAPCLNRKKSKGQSNSSNAQAPPECKQQ